MSFVTMRKALDNCKRFANNLGHVVNPMHDDDRERNTGMSKTMRQGVDIVLGDSVAEASVVGQCEKKYS